MISDLLKNEAKPFYEMEKISGACFAFNLRNDSYTFNFLFDPLFHMYYEDEDLCRRIKLIQSKIYLISEQAIFYHQHSHTTDKENADEISSNKIYSEIILRVKDPAKSTVRTLYGIFTTTATATFYHLLRAEVKKCVSQIKPLGMMFYHMGAIMKSRKRDILLIRKKV